MKTFRDKLLFLMDISNTNNLTLAKAIDVDPSMISLIRTGRRGMPRNKEHIRKMADFFALHIGSSWQMQQLAEALDFPDLNSFYQTLNMSELIFNWLCDTAEYTNSLTNFNQRLDTILSNENMANNPILSSSINSQSHKTNPSEIYLGNAGKAKALCDFYEYATSLDTPSTLYMTCDENPEWYNYDIPVVQKLNEYRSKLMAKGWHICHILPPVSSPDFYALLGRWIPCYLTGNVDVYYYPRVRDFSFRQTLFVIPDKILMYSTSIWNSSVTHITHVIYDSNIISPYLQTFKDFLSFCKPAFRTHLDADSIMKCFENFIGNKLLTTNHLQKNRSLSVESMPIKQLSNFIKLDDDLKPLMYNFLQNNDIPASEKYSRYISTDICPLATATQVKDGKVPLLFPGLDSDKTVYYTPEMYVIHLKNILNLLNNYDNYHFIPIPFNENDEDTYTVKENEAALLIRTVKPVALFEFVQFELINALNEHINKIIENTGYANYDLASRRKIISKIRHLINDLES